MKTITFLLFLLTITIFSFAQERKISVAVLDFQSGGSLGEAELRTLTSRFGELLIKTQVFRLIEFDQQNADRSGIAQNTAKDCISLACAVGIGRSLHAEAMVTGMINKLGDIYTVDLRLISVQAGEIVQNEVVDYEGKVNGLLGAIKSVADTFATKVKTPDNNSFLYHNVQSEKDQWDHVWYIIGGSLVVGGAAAVFLIGSGKKKGDNIPDPHFPPLD